MLIPKDRKYPHVSPTTKGAGTDVYRIWASGNEHAEKTFYRRKIVRGQPAHPFLQEGLAAALAFYT